MCCNVEDVGSTAHLTRAEGATTHLAACATLTTSRHSVSVVRPSGSVGRQCVRLRYRQSWAILPCRLPYLGRYQLAGLRQLPLRRCQRALGAVDPSVYQCGEVSTAPVRSP